MNYLALGPSSPQQWGSVAGPLLFIFFIVVLVSAVRNR